MSVQAERPDLLAEELLEPLAAWQFREVIGHFASGVSVVTTLSGDRPVGTTASALCSLSLEPPMLVVCMNRTSQTGAAIVTAGHFAVNILSEDQVGVARRFATKAPDKFTDVPFTLGPLGQPLLDGALAHVECRVADQATGGTHTVFLAEVQTATAWRRRPLAYFRGRYGRIQLDEDADADRR
ncbi:MAG: hypothetical protein JWN32_3769 [Solirubrobacterales bacterium]|nr:hypothetical protein [Solirubrobacterales bacterium]